MALHLATGSEAPLCSLATPTSSSSPSCAVTDLVIEKKSQTKKGTTDSRRTPSCGCGLAFANSRTRILTDIPRECYQQVAPSDENWHWGGGSPLSTEATQCQRAGLGFLLCRLVLWNLVLCRPCGGVVVVVRVARGALAHLPARHSRWPLAVAPGRDLPVHVWLRGVVRQHQLEALCEAQPDGGSSVSSVFRRGILRAHDPGLRTTQILLHQLF